MDIRLIPALDDNYIYLLRDGAAVGVVDPAEAAPVMQVLAREGWRLTHIFNTHHHADHIGGDRELKTHYGCPVIAPRADAMRIPAITEAVADGDLLEFGSQSVRVLGTPGHTRGHIAFWFPEAEAVFVGDTLFSLGCGRLFEGTPEQMWASLSMLRALPGQTRIYCGHEYTRSNARFALTIEPGNPALRDRVAEVEALRGRDAPTIPSTIACEQAANPFLRADVPSLQDAIGLPGADPAAVFAELRRRKDHF